MLIHVPLDYVLDNPFQRRQDYGDVVTFADDIRQRGLLQYPVGRLMYDGRPHEGHNLAEVLSLIRRDGWPDRSLMRVQLAFGHRRLRAFRHLAAHPSELLSADDAAEFTALPIEIVPYTDDGMLDAVWSENQHRSDINPIEQAELLAEKLERARAAGGNQQTVAAEWGLDRSTIANKVRLLELPGEVQTAVRERKLSERQALALLPIVELKAKVNGTAADYWDKDSTPKDYGAPITPDAFLIHTLAHPDKVTSDVIRDYGRRVVDRVGRKLPDYLATFDAGAAAQDVDQAEYIIQPTCAGCSHRHNQHCLNMPCIEAKWKLFQDRIPLLAAELTGLPWSADPECFPNEDLQLKALYDRDHRVGLVVGWQSSGWSYSKLYGSKGWQSPSETMQDWRVGLTLGRLPEYSAAVEDRQPPRREWREIVYKAKEQRREHVEQIFVDACAPLVDLYEDVQPLLFLLNRSMVKGNEPPERIIARIAHHAYRNLYLNDREEMREALREAGFNPDLADPADEIERLRETAAIALEDWYNYRDASTARRASAARAVEKAADLFCENGIGRDDDELGDLATWLELAQADATSMKA